MEKFGSAPTNDIFFIIPFISFQVFDYSAIIFFFMDQEDDEKATTMNLHLL